MKNLLQSYNLDDFEQLALLLQCSVCLQSLCRCVGRSWLLELLLAERLRTNRSTPHLNAQQQVAVSSGQVHHVRRPRQRVGDVARSLHSVRLFEWRMTCRPRPLLALPATAPLPRGFRRCQREELPRQRSVFRHAHLG